MSFLQHESTSFAHLFRTIFCATILISWSCGKSYAQPSLRSALQQPELGLSLGVMAKVIHLESNGSNAPKFGQHVDRLPYYYIPLNTIILYFPRYRINYEGNRWTLVLTEHGIWAMAPETVRGTRHILPETDLTRIYESFVQDQTMHIVIRSRVQLYDGRISLTLNEIWPISGGYLVAEEGNYFTGRGERSKISQIRNVLSSSPIPEIMETQSSVKIPIPHGIALNSNTIDANKLAQYFGEEEDELTEVPERRSIWPLGRNVPSDTRVERVKNWKSNWLRTFYVANDNIDDCNYIRTITLESSEKNAYSANMEAKIGIGIRQIGGILDSFGISLSADASVSRTQSETVTTTITTGSSLYEYRLILLEQSGVPRFYILTNSRDCIETDRTLGDHIVYEPSGPNYFRYKKDGVAGFVVDKEDFHLITSTNGNVQWIDRTGRISIECIDRDLGWLRTYFRREFQLDSAEIEMLLSRIIYLTGNEGRCDMGESAPDTTLSLNVVGR